jgi:hypothetical protein
VVEQLLWKSKESKVVGFGHLPAFNGNTTTGRCLNAQLMRSLHHMTIRHKLIWRDRDGRSGRLEVAT